MSGVKFLGAGSTRSGFPDIVGNVGELVFYMETKRDSKEGQTRLQSAVMRRLAKTGAATFVAHSTKEAKDFLDSLLKKTAKKYHKKNTFKKTPKKILPRAAVLGKKLSITHR